MEMPLLDPGSARLRRLAGMTREKEAQSSLPVIPDLVSERSEWRVSGIQVSAIDAAQDVGNSRLPS